MTLSYRKCPLLQIVVKSNISEMCIAMNRKLYGCGYHLQDAQLSQRDRAAGCVIVFAKSRILELGDNILQTL